MPEPKYYEEGGFGFEFVPEGGPFEGRLATRFPEVPPYVSNINLSSSRSRTAYAREAAEYCGVDESGLKGALIGVCALRSEEVAEAEQAGSDAEEELPEVSQEEIDERVGRPGVLARFAEAAAACSRVIGDRKHLELVALGASSAQLDPLPNGRPLGANIIVTAPPGRGKNYLADAVARLLPEDFCLPFESASSKSLYYAVAENPALLRNRWVYPNEAEATDLLVETLRPLLSGGLARHLTINKDASGRNVGQELTIEGPITVTIPTIRNKLDNQLQSRMLVAGLEDYEGRVAAHSGAITEQLSPEYAGTDHADEIRAWQASLGSLTGIRRVVVPTDDERFRFDSDDVPHGARLWANLLALMATHAWLEQRNREVIDLAGGGKAVVATAEDYEAAYHIFEATCERSVRNLSKTHRKILDAMYRLQNRREDKSEWNVWVGLSQREIARAAGVSQSTVSENKTFLVKSAKLVREVGEGGLALVKDAEPSWWHSGDALLGFPKPDEVKAWWAGNDPTPPSPEGADRTDHEGDTALEAASEAVNGDRRDADQERETDDHYEKKGAAQGDRRAEAGDRKVADQENGLQKANDASDEEVIGVIGGSLSDDLSFASIANSADHSGEPEGRPAPRARDEVAFPDGKSNSSDDDWQSSLELWLTRFPRLALDKLGWVCKKDFATENADATSESRRDEGCDVDRDPVALLIRTFLSRYLEAAITPMELFKREWYGLRRVEEIPGVEIPGGWPTTPQEMREHLERIAPALQGERPTYPGSMHENRQIRVQYWEKDGVEEGLWVFVCFGGDGPDDKLMEKTVWKKVSRIERLEEKAIEKMPPEIRSLYSW
jgi:transcriptional regulator with XRE-family HTH domain